MNQLEIIPLAESALEELESYFSGVLDRSKSIIEVKYYKEQRLDLIAYITNEIAEFLHDTNVDSFSKIEFLNIIKERLESFFKFKDVISDTYRNNIITFYNSSEKYNYSNHLRELDILIDIFKESTTTEARLIQLEAWEVFHNENYKLARIRLPYTNINETEIVETYKRIVDSGNLDAFLKYCYKEDWTDAPNSVKPYLNTILDYDIGAVKSSILWEILGYVLTSLGHLESITITFEDLFESKAQYNRVSALFKQNGIISFNNSTMGVVVPGSIDKHTVASLIAIAEALTELGYLKANFTIVEKVRIMAQSFNMKASKSSLTKKSPFHLEMFEKLRSLLSKSNFDNH